MTGPALFLIPTPLGEQDFSALFPPLNAELLSSIEVFFVEDIRTARRFLLKCGMKTPIDNLAFFSFKDYRKEVNPLDFLREHAAAGKNIGLLSDAGTPCVADPGHIVVAEAHRIGMRVVPLIGPNSVILALMASGLNGQNFSFNGYLPIDKQNREKQLLFLESLLLKSGQTQIFIETPYRNNQLLQSILHTCRPDTRLCVALNLTTPEEQIISATIAKWKKIKMDFHKQPAIFLLGK